MSKSFSSALSVVGGILFYLLFLQNLAFGQAAGFQRFDTQAAFTTANSSPTVISYDALTSGRLPTYEYTFATEGVKMKPNDPAYTETFYLNEWSSILPGKEIAITGTEGMEFNFTTPVNAFGYDFLEQTASLPGWSTAFTDSTFVISIYNGTTKLTEYTFTPANDVASFFGVSSTQTFDKVVIEETVGTVDDELYGKLYLKRNPPAQTTCAAGQYFCLSESICKPAGQTCNITTCNNNSTCELGESCNCADCTNGGDDDADKCGLSNGTQMVCTRDINNSTTAGSYGSVTAQENFNSVNTILAPYLSNPGNANIAVGEFGTAATELKMTQYDWKDTAGNFIFFTSFTRGEAWTKVKELLSIPAGAQVLWSTSSIKYENDSLGDNERYLYSYVIQQTSGVQKQIFFATEFLPGYGWRKIYFVSKDYPLSTTTTGTEVCQNFTNPTLFGKPLALGSPAVGSSGIAPFCLEQGFRGNSTVINSSALTGWLTLWKADNTGWKPNENGDKINEIRCCGVPSNATSGTVQVGACCPAGSQWSSVQNTCTTPPVPGCAQGEYYCHEELKCKPANEVCQAVVCEDKKVFTYTGAIQDYPVPADVSKIQIKTWGAGGGGTTHTSSLGGVGAYAFVSLPVVEGEIYKVVVGEGGKGSVTVGTFGGGGAGGLGHTSGGAGGGLSGIFKTSFIQANALLVAAGGGGSAGSCGANCLGGNGGGPNGGNGMSVVSGVGDFIGMGGRGGVLNGGGLGGDVYGTLQDGTPGNPLQGGIGGAAFTNLGAGYGGGGGGGGGYYGGGGGSGDTAYNAGNPNYTNDATGGGGSSSCPQINASGDCIVQAGAGSVVPKNTDADYKTGVGTAGMYSVAGGNGLVVITECRPKVTATCNNNSVCDENESCDCADCNEKADHCGLSGSGEQLICTKDTAPACYTDKFPYCLSGCLDGYKMDASGKCVDATTVVIPATPTVPMSCTVRRQAATPGNNATIVACNAGEVRTGGGCTSTNSSYRWKSFPVVGGQTPVGFNAIANDGWACQNGGTGDQVDAFAVCCTGAGTATTTVRKNVTTTTFAQVECSAGEIRLGGGCENTAGVTAFYQSFPFNAGEDPLGANGPTAIRDGWACLSGATGNQITAYAICRPATPELGAVNFRTAAPSIRTGATCNTGEKLIGGGHKNSGQSYHFTAAPMYPGDRIVNAWWDYTATSEIFYTNTGTSGDTQTPYALCASSTTPATTTSGIPNNCTIRRVNNNSLANIATCQTGEKRVGGGCGNTGGGAFRYASFPIAKNGTYTASSGTVLTALEDGWACDTGSTGTNVEASAVCCTGSDLDGTYTIRKESDAYVVSTVECQAGEKRIGGGCRNVGGSSVNYGSFPIIGGQAYQDGARYTIPAPARDGWLCDPGSSGQVTEAFAICLTPASGKNPIININKGPDTSSPAFGVCSANETLLGGGCRNTAGGGYHFGGVPMHTGDIWASRSFTATGNGFACNDGSTGTSTESYALCLSASTTTVITTPTTTPQLGACCPPGSAWNSEENRCVPTTCGEGQFYCAAQKKCLAGGTTCETTVCVNDGVCSGDESCQCADCVDSPNQTDPAKKTDDKDKCSIVSGVQAMCSDDLPNDGKPGACCIPPKKWSTTANGGAGACLECTNTQAPAELKAGVDEPYITCTGNGDTTKTHFKYRITKQGSTATTDTFISEPFTVGTQVLHTAPLALGSYTVECFYGTAASVDTSTVATPHSCTKTTVVSDAANGCSRLYPYKGSTLSDEMISNTAFDASFRCGSRLPVTGTVTNPYMFRVGTTPFIYLPFDSLISELFNGLAIGPVSQQTDSYNFTTGNTDVTCAVKIGGGYSTNSSCKLTACSGANCNTPQTFSVIHSGDLTCTSEDTGVYNIGCNPEAADPIRKECVKWFNQAITAKSTTVADGVKFSVPFTFNSTNSTVVDCVKYAAGKMPGVLNLGDNIVCEATLNNGERYQIYAADANGQIAALQSTAKTVERDAEAPTISALKYYTDDSLTTEVLPTSWYNKPVVALAVCSDTPLNESTACACAPTVDSSTTNADLWSPGVPNNLIGADLMRYTRIIANNFTTAQTIRITDKAGNQSPTETLSVALDAKPPLVTVTEVGTGTTKSITLTVSDPESKIWKTTTAPTTPASTNTNGIIYRTGTKANIANLTFGTDCGVTPSYATITETASASFPTQATVTIPNINTATQVVTYCIRDNAGNTTRGVFPSAPDACFSASDMTTIPTIETYKTILTTRLSGAGNDNQKFGYSFSENTTDANCFRGILANNITTLMTNQLKPRSTTTLSNWDTDRAELSTSTTLSNGYYYYVYPTVNTLDITTSPSTTGAPVKSVVVEGGDIRIKTDMSYTGTGKTLLIIARKNNAGQGGNIIIDSNVKRIDALLIADGGALKSSDASTPGERLTINGRLYSYNTRGGSLVASGSDLVDATSPKKFTNNALVSASSLTDARIQDLERFRTMIPDSINTCSLHIEYRSFTTTDLPVLLKRPNGFNGGSCGF